MLGLRPGAASFDGSPFITLCARSAIVICPLFRSSTINRFILLSPRSSPFPLATISLAIHFGILFCLCCPSVILFESLETVPVLPLASRRYPSNRPTIPTQQVTILSTPHRGIRRTATEIYQTVRHTETPVKRSSHSFDISPIVILNIDLFILDQIDKFPPAKDLTRKLQYRSLRVLNNKDSTFCH